MSTYSDASLILPVAPERKAGKIYSLKPTDGTGDFTVARTTACDEIDSTGESVEVAANVPRFDFKAPYVAPTDNSYYDCPSSTGLVSVANSSFNSVGTGNFTALVRVKIPSGIDGTKWIFAKGGSGNIGYALYFSASGQLKFSLETSSGDSVLTSGGFAITEGTAYDISVRVDRTGSMVMRVDGVDVGTLDISAKVGETADYSNPLKLGGYGGSEAYDKDIYAFWLDNRLMTTTEIDDRFDGVAIPSDYVGAGNIVYNSDFSVNTDSFTGIRATSSGNIDSILGIDDTLRIYASVDNNSHYIYRSSSLDATRGCYVTFDYYIPAANTNVDGLSIGTGIGAFVESGTVSITGSWQTASILVDNSDSILSFRMTSGGSTSFAGAGVVTDDLVYFKNIKVTTAGNTLNLSTGKTSATWYDLDHPIQGTITGATLTDSTDFGNNTYPLNTCPALLTEPAFNTYFLNSRTPVTQTITTLSIGTTYTCNCKGVGIITIEETGGSGKGGTATEVDSFTWVATQTSVDITLEAGSDFDWVQVTDTSYPMNHVNTTSPSVAKVADDVSKTGVTSIIGQTEGSFFIDMVILSDNNAFSNIFNTNKSVVDSVSIVKSNSLKTLLCNIYANSVLVSTLSTTTTYEIGDRVKVLLIYKSGDNRLFVNGVKEDSNTTAFTFSGALDGLFLNDATTYFGYQQRNRTNNVQLTDTIYTDAQAITLTTL